MNHGPLRPLAALLLLLFVVSGLYAQDSGPRFRCTRTESGAETLVWENRPVTCGPYVATAIYRSSEEDGPYTLLDTLQDLTATEYRDPNPSGVRNFYYLEYLVDCPGTPPQVSDTLDNLIPQLPLLRFVSVVDGDLLIAWDRSESPEVTDYAIVEVTPFGIVPIGLVDSTTFRVTDVPADELTTRQYQVVALDSCGNDSPLSRIASANELVGRGGEGCDSDVVLSTIGNESNYVLGTASGPAELFVSVDGGPFTAAEYSLVSEFELGYSGGNSGETLCFYLQTSILESTETIRSSIFCKTLTTSQPIRDFELYGVDVQPGGALRFRYAYPDPPPTTYVSDLEPEGAGLLEGVLGENLLSSTETVTPDVPGLVGPGTRLRFVLTDSCGRQGTTNYVTPVFLAAQTEGGGSVRLDWNPLENGLAGTTTYTLERLEADTSVALYTTTDAAALEYTDQEAAAGEQRCYRVVIAFQPAGSDETYLFYSLPACTVPNVEVYVPNAFSPTAMREENTVFLPRFNGTLGIVDYQLAVYDRWGGLVFRSADPDMGWDGRLNDRTAPTGSYVYVLAYTVLDRAPVQRSGVVNLIQ